MRRSVSRYLNDQPSNQVEFKHREQYRFDFMENKKLQKAISRAQHFPTYRLPIQRHSTRLKCNQTMDQTTHSTPNPSQQNTIRQPKAAHIFPTQPLE